MLCLLELILEVLKTFHFTTIKDFQPCFSWHRIDVRQEGSVGRWQEVGGDWGEVADVVPWSWWPLTIQQTTSAVSSGGATAKARTKMGTIRTFRPRTQIHFRWVLRQIVPARQWDPEVGLVESNLIRLVDKMIIWRQQFRSILSYFIQT